MERKIRDEIIDMLQKVEKGMDYAQAANKAAMLEDCIAALRLLAASCQQELSAQRYEEAYAEIFAGLLQALSIGQQETIADQQLQEACQLAKEIMRYLEQMLREEKEVKKEIVFMPYKASMWDALESIWQAAVSDQEHCNAYVVPLPYCDRNPDGTVKEWHCETKLFPPAVPVVDYREYDLAAHHPDIIYIHNPYDDYNKATSVSCEYYSRELKKHTDLLVYVPYFVTGTTIEPHFCQAPGIINADYVIVESEAIKEQYEKYYPGGNPPAGKFLALGSPKYDKVLSSRKEDFTLPKSWQELIKGRKIILYNTSVQAAMEHHGTVNQKLRYVFSQFRDRKDVVLWWRPHPLMKACLGSVTPDALPEYERIEQEYQKASWGIFDDTPELHRAICYSDAYYGDASSVVQLYQKTEKPVMIENITKLDSFLLAEPAQLCIEGHIAWYVDRNFNALFQIDLQTDQIKYLAMLDEYAPLKDLDYDCVIKQGNKLFVIPCFSDKGMFIYDLVHDTGHFVKLNLSKSPLHTDSIPKAFFALKYQQKLYILRYDVPEVIEYDSVTDIYKSYLVPKQEGDSSSHLCRYAKLDNRLMITMTQSNLIIEFNMDTKKYSFHPVGDRKNQYAEIILDGKYCWLNQSVPGRSIVKWNWETGAVEEYKEYPYDVCFTDCLPGYGGFTGMCRHGEKIFLFPTMTNQVLTVDIHTGEICTEQILTKLIVQGQMNFKWVNDTCMYDGRIYVPLCNKGCMLEKSMEQVVTHNLVVRDEKFLRVLQNISPALLSAGIVQNVSLPFFLQAVLTASMKEKQLMRGQTCGKAVFSQIIEKNLV